MATISLPQHKHCRDKKCEESNPQPLHEFSADSRMKDGLRSYCRSCRRREYREWASKYPEKVRARNTVYGKTKPHLKRYGISLNEYNFIFEQQEGRCALCKRHQTELNRSLAVDHCHKSGKIRGLLCFDCNTALDKFRDSPELLIQAAGYLEANK